MFVAAEVFFMPCSADLSAPGGVNPALGGGEQSGRYYHNQGGHHTSQNRHRTSGLMMATLTTSTSPTPSDCTSTGTAGTLSDSGKSQVFTRYDCKREIGNSGV